MYSRHKSFEWVVEQISKLRVVADCECYPHWVSEPSKVLNVHPEIVPIPVLTMFGSNLRC